MGQAFLYGQSGNNLKLNIFAQPDLPTDKFDGLALLTSDKYKKIVTRASGFQIPGRWRGDTTDKITDLPNYISNVYPYVNGGYDTSQVVGDYFVVCTKTSSTSLYHYYSINLKTNTVVDYSSSQIGSASSYFISGSFVKNGKIYAVINYYITTSSIRTIIVSFDPITQTETLVDSRNNFYTYSDWDFVGSAGLIAFDSVHNNLAVLVRGRNHTSTSNLGYILRSYTINEDETVTFNGDMSSYPYYSGVNNTVEGLFYDPSNDIYVATSVLSVSPYTVYFVTFKLDTSKCFTTNLSIDYINSGVHYAESSFTLLDGKIYFFINTASQQLFYYNIATRTFTACATAPFTVAGYIQVQGTSTWVCVTAFDGKLYLYSDSGLYDTTYNYIYNPDTDTWSTIPRDTTNQYFTAPSCMFPYYNTADNTVTLIGHNRRTVYISALVMTGEILEDLTLAIRESKTGYQTKIITKDDMYFKTGIADAWLFKSGAYQELPMYIGDGTQWNHIKN